MNIAEFREKNPEYSHVDDNALSEALYQKYYSHADKNEFMMRFVGEVAQAPEISPEGGQPTDINPKRNEQPIAFSAGARPKQPVPDDDLVKALRSSPMHRLMQVVLQSQGGPSFGELIREAVVNSPESAVNFGEAMVQPVIHPVDTFNGIKGLVKGLFQKVTGAEQQPDGPNVDALVQYYSNRYGDIPSFKQAVAEDPVGVAADVSLALSGAGGTLRASGKLSKIGPLGEAGRKLAAAGNAVEPINILKQATAGAAVKMVPKEAPSKLYESAAKFPTGKSVTPGDRKRAVNTALEHGFVPKESEIGRIWSRITENSDKVDAIIDEAAKSGETISKQRLISEIPELGEKPHPQMVRRKKALDKLSGELLEAFPDEIPVDQVQQLKRTIHRELENYYKNTAPKPAIINEFNGAVARAAMMELERLYPELQSVNKQTSDYLHLVKILENSAKRIANKEVVNLGTVVKGAAGYSIGDVGGLIGGLALGVLERDVVKSQLAIILNRAKKQGLKTRSSIPKNAAYGVGQINQQTERKGK